MDFTAALKKLKVVELRRIEHQGRTLVVCANPRKEEIDPCLLVLFEGDQLVAQFPEKPTKIHPQYSDVLLGGEFFLAGMPKQKIAAVRIATGEWIDKFCPDTIFGHDYTGIDVDPTGRYGLIVINDGDFFHAVLYDTSTEKFKEVETRDLIDASIFSLRFHDEASALVCANELTQTAVKLSFDLASRTITWNGEDFQETLRFDRGTIVEPRQATKVGHHLMSDAIRACDIRLLCKLLARHDPNFTPDGHSTLVAEAMRHSAEHPGDLNFLRALVDAGCTFDDDLIVAAAARNYVEAFEYLLPLQQQPFTAERASACLSNLTFDHDLPDAALVKRLLELGANPNVVMEYRAARPIIHVAAQHGHFDIVKMLIAAGADVRVRSDAGNTTLHNATTPEMIQYLLGLGLDIHARSNDGSTPLHVAAWSDSPTGVAAFLDHGADPNLTDNDGRTPLKLGEDLGRMLAVKYLKERLGDSAK